MVSRFQKVVKERPLVDMDVSARRLLYFQRAHPMEPGKLDRKLTAIVIPYQFSNRTEV